MNRCWCGRFKSARAACRSCWDRRIQSLRIRIYMAGL